MSAFQCIVLSFLCNVWLSSFACLFKTASVNIRVPLYLQQLISDSENVCWSTSAKRTQLQTSTSRTGRTVGVSTRFQHRTATTQNQRMSSQLELNWCEMSNWCKTISINERLGAIDNSNWAQTAVINLSFMITFQMVGTSVF